MNSTEFCYWLQGLFELGNPVELNNRQTALIKQHLNLVFDHVIAPSTPPSAVENTFLNRPDGVRC